MYKVKDKNGIFFDPKSKGFFSRCIKSVFFNADYSIEKCMHVQQSLLEKQLAILNNNNEEVSSSFFTKMSLNNKNIYLQLPKCVTKQSIVEALRGKYCDLHTQAQIHTMHFFFQQKI